MNKITILSLISFDNAMLLESLATYIDAVDEVVLALDSGRTTWAGQQFEVADSFFAELRTLDKNQKVKIVEERFFKEGAQPMENYTHVRNVLSTKAEPDSWLVSIDPDETIVNLQEFIDFLRTFAATNVCVFGKQIVVLKQDGENIFVVENEDWAKDDVALATKKRNSFTNNRYTGQSVAFAPVYVINNSWGRSNDALALKLHHSPYFAELNFDGLLKSVIPSNYLEFKDFNPFGGPMWERINHVTEGLDAYAMKKLEALRQSRAWDAVTLGARASLFEGKVQSRDINIADIKKQHEADVAKMRSEYETKLAANVRSYKELKMQLDAELLANKARSQR